MKLHGYTFDIETQPYGSIDLAPFVKKAEPFDPEACKREFATAREDSPKGRDFLLKKAAEHEAKIEQAKREFADKAALKPETGSIIALGVITPTNEENVITGTEKAILGYFWDMYHTATTKGQRMYGWNIADFDVPFIMRRSWKNGVSVPQTVLVSRRYLCDDFVDLKKIYACGVYGEHVSLDIAAKHLLGLGKSDQEVTGATFHKYFNGTEAERQLALDYLKRDLRLTKAVGEIIA
jgi:hypothetical protein